MSLYVVELDRDPYARMLDDLWRSVGVPRRWLPFQRFPPPLDVVIRDCNEHDGEWPAFITLAHETVEWEGRAVPLFEGDVERQEWERARRLRRR